MLIAAGIVTVIELVTAFEIGSVPETVVVAVVHLVHFILSPITTYPTVQPSSIFVSLSNPVHPSDVLFTFLPFLSRSGN